MSKETLVFFEIECPTSVTPEIKKEVKKGLEGKISLHPGIILKHDERRISGIVKTTEDALEEATAKHPDNTVLFVGNSGAVWRKDQDEILLKQVY